SPRSSFPMTCAELRLSRDKIGPKTAPGRMVVSVVLPSTVFINSHAACSANVFERRYGMSVGSFESVHSVSSVTLSLVYDDGLASVSADVLTTRLTPAATAARNTRIAPSRAGIMRSFGLRELFIPSGEAA